MHVRRKFVDIHRAQGSAIADEAIGRMAQLYAVERAMRSIAIGRKNYLFVGSQTGGKAAAIAYTLIETAKLNGIDPQACLSDTLARIPDYKINRVDDLLPWKNTP